MRCFFSSTNRHFLLMHIFLWVLNFSASETHAFVASDSLFTVASSSEMLKPCADIEKKDGFSCLSLFANHLVSNSLNIKAADRDMKAAYLESRKKLLQFNPELEFSEFSSNSTNRDFNPVSGLEEDYKSDRRGNTFGLKQQTPIGTTRISMEKSDTQFTGSTKLYFESLYFSIESGLLRRDSRIMALENGMARTYYSVEEAKNASVKLDTLYQGFSALFDRILISQNAAFKKKNLDFYKTIVDEAIVKLDNGLGSELDLKQAKMRLSLAETALHESNLSLKEADRNLGIILSSSEWDKSMANFDLHDLIKIIPGEFDFEKTWSVAMQTRPDLRIIHSQLKLQQQNLSLASEKSKPNIVATARTGRQGRSGDPGLASSKPDKNWDVMLSWNTVVGHRSEKLNRRIERERLEALKKRYIQTEEKSRGGLKNAIERLEFNKQNLCALRDAASLSGDVLEGQKINFQLGSISLLDMARYQSDYEEACLSVIRAEAALVMSWLRYLYETGELCNRFDSVKND
ncbi:MAG: TolC family protein [Candidatus Riflebacteria bacterium]|nr:TolC family protein [Candidatus Riflebacteria bacterium]